MEKVLWKNVKCTPLHIKVMSSGESRQMYSEWTLPNVLLYTIYYIIYFYF